MSDRSRIEEIAREVKARFPERFETWRTHSTTSLRLFEIQPLGRYLALCKATPSRHTRVDASQPIDPATRACPPRTADPDRGGSDAKLRRPPHPSIVRPHDRGRRPGCCLRAERLRKDDAAPLYRRHAHPLGGERADSRIRDRHARGPSLDRHLVLAGEVVLPAPFRPREPVLL